MTTPHVLCIVCQAHPYDPPKGCEFCPDSAIRLLERLYEEERQREAAHADDRLPLVAAIAS